MPAAATRIKMSVDPISGIGMSDSSSGFPTCTSRTALISNQPYKRFEVADPGPTYFFSVTRVTVKISLGRTCPSGLPGPSCEMMRDLKTFSVSSMISSTDVESDDSSLNRQVSINWPCSIRHFPCVLSPSSGGSRTHVPSARY